jgi:glutamate-1-semialdehyde aminotransferase
VSTDELSRRLNIALGELCFPKPFEDGAPNGYIHPCIASHGKAGHLTDSSGVEYIDYHSSWGTNILGYGYPRVVEMVQAQLRAGSYLGLPNIPFIEAAELLREMIPCAEKVAFAKNGSDATEGAVRLARTVTGRERILACGFHGFHDWYMASDGECRGIPACLRRLVDQIPYNNLAGVDRKFREVPDSVAAVIIDPVSDRSWPSHMRLKPFIPVSRLAFSFAASISAPLRYRCVVTDHIPSGHRWPKSG